MEKRSRFEFRPAWGMSVNRQITKGQCRWRRALRAEERMPHAKTPRAKVQRAAVGDQRSEVGGQRAGITNWGMGKLEVRGQRSEDSKQ